MPGDLLLPFNARSPEEARAEVNRQQLQHADFIKIILLPRAALFAAIDEAKRLGLPTAGHLPPDVAPLEASKAGFTRSCRTRKVIVTIGICCYRRLRLFDYSMTPLRAAARTRPLRVPDRPRR